MSKSVPQAVIHLTDQQVRILAEAARMGLPEMFVRLSAISAVVKVVSMTTNAIIKRNKPDIYITQNINGENLDPETIGQQMKDHLKQTATEVVSDMTRKAVFSDQGEVVKGETVDEEEGQDKGGLPKTTFDIPKQPTTEALGETPEQ